MAWHLLTWLHTQTKKEEVWGYEFITGVLKEQGSYSEICKLVLVSIQNYIRENASTHMSEKSRKQKAYQMEDTFAEWEVNFCSFSILGLHHKEDF